jgi:hypothetical protein
MWDRLSVGQFVLEREGLGVFTRLATELLQNYTVWARISSGSETWQKISPIRNRLC